MFGAKDESQHLHVGSMCCLRVMYHEIRSTVLVMVALLNYFVWILEAARHAYSSPCIEHLVQCIDNYFSGVQSHRNRSLAKFANSFRILVPSQIACQARDMDWAWLSARAAST